ncbi:MAG TPA: hypothetical protein ENJ95_05765 [Bacteroidetes bacterium]|nr:hypothetical protein [Bacteroidota bacterium]
MKFPKEKIYLSLAILLIVLITVVIPYFAKGWLVAETGKLEILPFWGVIIAIGLARKWRHIRKVALAAFALPMAFSLFMLLQNPGEWGFYFWAFSNALLLFILWSGTMKAYFEKNQNHVSGASINL